MTDTTACQRLFSWNSVSLLIPDSWQAIVEDSQHLIFEEEFQAVFEIKWKTAAAQETNRLVKSSVQQWQKLAAQSLKECSLDEKSRKLFSEFTVSAYSSKDARPKIIFLYCSKRKLFLMLQFFPLDGKNHPIRFIASIECGKDEIYESLWSIQDFRLRIPCTYTFSGHTMKAGLTTLHFHKRKKALHICRLAPAAMRLKKNTLSEILHSLLSLNRDTTAGTVSGNEVTYERSPTIFQQILLRLQRKKPFLLASLRHDVENDRLLGVIAEDIHPIDQIEFNKIRDRYEIFQLR